MMKLMKMIVKMRLEKDVWKFGIKCLKSIQVQLGELARIFRIYDKNFRHDLKIMNGAMITFETRNFGQLASNNV